MNSALQHLRIDFLSIMREECLNVLSLVSIRRDIFIDYEKTIDIYGSRYTSKILLINPLSEN